MIHNIKLITIFILNITFLNSFFYLSSLTGYFCLYHHNPNLLLEGQHFCYDLNLKVLSKRRNCILGLTQKNLIEFLVQNYILDHGLYATISKGYVVYIRPTYYSHIVIMLSILEPSTSFSMLCDFVTITITCNQTYNNCHDFFIDCGNCDYHNSLTKFK